MFAAMFAKDIYKDFLLQLQQIYPLGEATVMADWLFEHTASLKKKDWINNDAIIISKEIQIKINKQLSELLLHKPIQYVLGEAWFYNLRFQVNEHTLIPRPETEELVQLVINDLQLSKNLNVLDIGTGSGCIPIALKKNIPLANITSIDISNDAIAIATENAKTHNTDINFASLNFLNEIEWNILSMFNVIVSNPPYIPINEKEKLDRNVTKYEPHTALFVPNENPYLFYKKIAKFAKLHLTQKGKIFVECHENFAKETALVFCKNGFSTQIINDMFGKERMIVAC